MRWVSALIALATVTGCYSPELRNCTVTCASATECAPGQVCQAGWCMRAGAADCTPAGSLDAAGDTGSEVVDGAATPIDGPSLCAQGCSMGTCDGEVCVIDCRLVGSCLNEVVCPANLPCRVECGDFACAKKIICELSTSCEVLCTGTDSCHDEIKCGTGPCDVTCSGADSCDRRTKCGLSCSCDVRCTGESSCNEVSECPGGTACRLANGCTSQLAGCDGC